MEAAEALTEAGEVLLEAGEVLLEAGEGEDRASRKANPTRPGPTPKSRSDTKILLAGTRLLSP